MRSVGCRARSLASGLAALVVAGLSIWVPAADASSVSTTANPGQAATAAAIARAFRALDLPPVPRGRALLQGYDTAMRLALQQAGTRLLSGTNGGPLTVSNSTGRVTVVRPGEAMVPLTVSVKTKFPPPSYSLEYTAVALEEPEVRCGEPSQLHLECGASQSRAWTSWSPGPVTPTSARSGRNSRETSRSAARWERGSASS
jgi:hypothetical protein